MARSRALAAVLFTFVGFSSLLHCSSASDPPVPDTGGGGSERDPEAAARAAVFRGSCLPRSENPSDILDRMYRDQHAPGSWGERMQYAGLDCFSGATRGCQALSDCVGITVDPAPISDYPCKSSCTGGVFEQCTEGKRIRIDCARHGLSCHPDAGCVEAPAVSCDVAVFRASCRDGRPTVCANGVLQAGPRCRDLGLVCENDGYPECRPPSALSCSGGTTNSALSFTHEGAACSGRHLETCLDSEAGKLDCTSVARGFTCQTRTFSHFCGQGTECTPTLRAHAICEGTALVLCNAGKIERIDCTALGFTGCDAARGVCTPNPW